MSTFIYLSLSLSLSPSLSLSLSLSLSPILWPGLVEGALFLTTNSLKESIPLQISDLQLV